MGALLDSFYTFHPENHNRKVYIFLDEVQNVEGWELVLRRYLDSKNVEIYITGSSAKLLSKEIATSLRGRSIAIEMWPFDINEYHQLHKKPLKLKAKGKASLDKFRQTLTHYILQGGLPEVQLLDAFKSTQLIRDYVDVITYRDIIERYNISNITALNYMIKSLLSNPASEFSTNKLFLDLKSQGIKIGKETLYDFSHHIEDTYLTFFVPLLSDSIRKTQSNPRKVYSIDTGLLSIFSQNPQNALGHLFENLIYLDLRRYGFSISYYLTKERYEIDFHIESWNKKRYLLQVCWNMQEPHTIEREKRALEHAQKELNIDGMIVTPETYTDFLEVLSKLNQ